MEDRGSRNRKSERAIELFSSRVARKEKDKRTASNWPLLVLAPLSLLVEKHFGKVGRPFRRPSRFCRKPETLREANIRTLLSIEKRKEKCFSWTKVCHRHANPDIIGWRIVSRIYERRNGNNWVLFFILFSRIIIIIWNYLIILKNIFIKINFYKNDFIDDKKYFNHRIFALTLLRMNISLFFNIIIYIYYNNALVLEKLQFSTFKFTI